MSIVLSMYYCMSIVLYECRVLHTIIRIYTELVQCRKTNPESELFDCTYMKLSSTYHEEPLKS